MSRPGLGEIAEEWRQNPRLRIGALLILLILLWSGAELLRDQEAEAAKAYGREQTKLVRLQGIESQAQWLDLAEQARAARVKQEQTFWRAESLGLAQATIESWLTPKLHQLKLDDLKMKVDKAEALPDRKGIWRVPVTLSGGLKRSELTDLLGMLELNDRLVVIERLDLKPAKDGLLVDMVAAGLFLAADGGAAP